MARHRYVGVGAGLSLHVMTWPAAWSTPKPSAGADMPRADAVGSHADADGSRADAAPILLLHGLASSARSWEPVAKRLAAAGHHVVAADFRGHGLSDKPDDGYDLATVIVTARTTHVVRALQFATVRAFLECFHGQLVMAAAHAALGRRSLSFGDGHFGETLFLSGSQRDYARTGTSATDA